MASAPPFSCRSFVSWTVRRTTGAAPWPVQDGRVAIRPALARTTRPPSAAHRRGRAAAAGHRPRQTHHGLSPLAPGVQFAPVRVDRAERVVPVPPDGQALVLLPPLHRTHVAVEVGGDLLPRIQPILGRWLNGRARVGWALGEVRHATPPSNAIVALCRLRGSRGHRDSGQRVSGSSTQGCCAWPRRDYESPKRSNSCAQGWCLASCWWPRSAWPSRPPASPPSLRWGPGHGDAPERDGVRHRGRRWCLHRWRGRRDGVDRPLLGISS